MCIRDRVGFGPGQRGGHGTVIQSYQRLPGGHSLPLGGHDLGHDATGGKGQFGGRGGQDDALGHDLIGGGGGDRFGFPLGVDGGENGHAPAQGGVGGIEADGDRVDGVALVIAGHAADGRHRAGQLIAGQSVGAGYSRRANGCLLYTSRCV